MSILAQAQKQANDGLFKGIDQQQDSLQADARQLERLQSAAQGAVGQMQAIQYANQLASAQGNQLLQIRGLLIAQKTPWRQGIKYWLIEKPKKPPLANSAALRSLASSVRVAAK